MTRRRTSRGRIAAGALGLLATAGAALAHPVHNTFAEAVWNPKSRSIEVALRVRGVDLEAALTAEGEKRVDLDHTPDIDAMILAYLVEHVTLLLPDGKQVAPRWSAKDVGITNSWLYFEFPLPESASPPDCRLRNTVFFGALEGQKNIVEYREGRSRRILSFEGAARELPFAGEEE